MDAQNFSFNLKKMKKSRIQRLKQILFELYPFERNKYEISKIVGVTAQAIGPEIDILENSDLISKVRVEKTRGIPAYYYSLNIDSLLDSLSLDPQEKTLLKELLTGLRPTYGELKTLENERKIQTLETIYEGIIPTDHKMFALQFTSSILIIGALIFNYFSALPDILRGNIQLFSMLENYANEIQMNIKINDPNFSDWINKNVNAIGKLYSKIWNEYMQTIVMASIIKEPSMKILDKFEESKMEDLKTMVESFRNYTKSKKGLDDFIDEERKIKDQCENNLRNVYNPLLRIQDKVLKDNVIEPKIETIRSRINSLSNKIRTASLSLLSYPTEKEKIENMKIKIAILKSCNQEINKLQNELEPLEKSITFEKQEEIEPQLQKIFSLTQNLEKLQKWHADPKEFLEKPIEKSKINKEEIDMKIKNLIDKLKEEKVNLLSDFITKFYTEYPNIDIDQNDLLSGVKRLGKDSLYPYIEPVKLGKLGREKIIRFDSTEKDQTEILRLAASAPNGKVTVENIELQLNWPFHRARIVLDDLLNSHKIFYKNTRVDGEVWYVPGVK